MILRKLPVFMLCTLLVATGFRTGAAAQTQGHAQKQALKRYLYVAVPGIRDYMGYGGHGILVFDMDNDHRFVKRIATNGYHSDKTPSNVKGVPVSIPLNSIYIDTLESLQRIDLTSEKVV